MKQLVAQMAQDTQASNANNQPLGSKPKGGISKRYSNTGPRPARHIPWPEIFKHHISVVEGHLKMIDMIRKHTVEGSGNWNTIVDMIKRTQDMLRMAKDVSRSFVPPPNIREQVPIGSSSASMYPGYSPADHEYGQAAQEFGAQWSAAKAQGIEFKPEPNGPQYEIGQSRGAKRETLVKIREVKAKREGSTSGSGSDTGHSQRKPSEPSTHHKEMSNASDKPPIPKESKSGNEEPAELNPYFVVDTNPTPVNLPGISHQPTKRSSQNGTAIVDISTKKYKKSKNKHEAEISSPHVKRVEFEDITEEVDARMNEKEKRNKRKEKKDRKRKAEELTESQEIATAVEEPKSKKGKRKSDVADPNGETSAKKRERSDDAEKEDRNGVTSTAEEIAEQAEKPKKKKSKKHEDAPDTNGETAKKRKETSADVEAEEHNSSNPRKKKKKAKKSTGEAADA